MSECVLDKEVRVCVSYKATRGRKGGEGAPVPQRHVSASRAETIKEAHSENKQVYEKILVSENFKNVRKSIFFLRI